MARVRGFFEAVEPLVGTAPLECNSDLRRSTVPRVGTAAPSALAEWFACAQAASATRRPFLVVLEQPPFEGWSLTGVVGGRDGTIRAFNYYEGCCWPPTPTLSAGVCESPTARSDHGGLYGVRCANENESGFVPVPEHWLRAPPLPSDLAERLRVVTGDEVVDCGLEVHSFSPAFSVYFLRQAFGCAEAARISRRPFQLLFQQRSLDSTIVVGLVGTATGAVRRFHYDSAPCGGPGCPPAFDVRPCARPAIVESQSTADIACDAAASPREPPSRRRPGS